MKGKPSKQSRGRNAAEDRFYSWLGERDCCTCGNHGVVIHHPKGQTYKKDKVHCGHMYAIPLCPACHDFRHQHKKAFIGLYGQECELWLFESVIYSLDDSDKEPPEDIKIAIMSTRS